MKEVATTEGEAMFINSIKMRSKQVILKILRTGQLMALSKGNSYLGFTANPQVTEPFTTKRACARRQVSSTLKLRLSNVVTITKTSRYCREDGSWSARSAG